jgi:ankyrin repeat protein
MDAMKKETPGLLTHLRKKQESMNNYTDLGLLVQYIQNNTLTEENIKNHIHVINSHTQLGRKTPLHVATEENKDLFVEILIKNGADVNIPDSHDNTPLHIAAQKNEPKIVKLLLKARANSNEKNKDGKTPLDLTKDNTIKSLLEANRLLIAAVKEGIPTSVDAMLEKGANLDIRDENDNNLLMIAARNNQVNMIDFLITQKKIDVNTLKETNGNTALHIAAAKGDIEFVTALLKHGANAYISNEDGKTALDVVTDRLNNPKNHDPEKVSKLSKIIHILSHKND